MNRRSPKEEYALEREKAFIARFGIESLCNKSLGGIGYSRISSEEYARRRQSWEEYVFERERQRELWRYEQHQQYEQYDRKALNRRLREIGRSCNAKVAAGLLDPDFDPNDISSD